MFLNQNRKTSHDQIFIKFKDKKIFDNTYVLEEWDARTGKIVTKSFEKTKDQLYK